MGDGDDNDADRDTDPAPPTYDDLVDSTASGPPARPSGTRRRALRVLVAQHEPGLRSALLLALSKTGFEAVGIGDGRSAVLNVEAQPPDVIIADVQLPRVAGDSLLRWACARLGPDLLVSILIAPQGPRPPMRDCDVVLVAPTAQAVLDALHAELETRRNGTQWRA